MQVSSQVAHSRQRGSGLVAAGECAALRGGLTVGRMLIRGGRGSELRLGISDRWLEYAGSGRRWAARLVGSGCGEELVDSVTGLQLSPVIWVSISTSESGSSD